MNNSYYYCRVPQRNTVYKIQEDCCYQRVVYDGEQMGVYPSRFDRENEHNGILLCRCDLKMEIIQISEHEFWSVFEEVKAGRKVVYN